MFLCDYQFINLVSSSIVLQVHFEVSAIAERRADHMHAQVRGQGHGQGQGHVQGHGSSSALYAEARARLVAAVAHCPAPLRWKIWLQGARLELRAARAQADVAKQLGCAPGGKTAQCAASLISYSAPSHPFLSLLFRLATESLVCFWSAPPSRRPPRCAPCSSSNRSPPIAFDTLSLARFRLPRRLCLLRVLQPSLPPPSSLVSLRTSGSCRGVWRTRGDRALDSAARAHRNTRRVEGAPLNTHLILPSFVEKTKVSRCALVCVVFCLCVY